MNDITLSISNLTEYTELYNGLRKGQTPTMAIGLPPVSRAQLAAALHLQTGRPVLLVTSDEAACRRLSDDLAALAERSVLRLPERDFVMLGVESSSRQFEQARIAALWQLLQGAPLAACSVPALVQACIPPEILRKAAFCLREGETHPLSEITAQLTAAGYQRCAQVEGAGQFSVRGGILDLFPPQENAPVRVELWGDDIDSMAYFDVGSQRRGARLAELICLPCTETLPGMAEGGVEGLCTQLEQVLRPRRKQHPKLEEHVRRDIERLRETGALPAADKYLPLIYPEGATGLDYLPPDTLLLLDDTPSLRETAKGLTLRIAADIEALTERGELPPQTGYVLTFSQLAARVQDFASVRMDAFLNSIPELAPKTLVSFTVSQMNAYGGNASMAAADIAGYAAEGRAVVVLCASTMRCQNMLDALDTHGLTARIADSIPASGQVHVTEGMLSAGFDLGADGLTVITEGQILSRRTRRAKGKKSSRDHVKSYADLTPGDLIVHEHHGIGRFVGMEGIEVDGCARDFVKISFAGTDFLYVPATSLDLISKYIGGGGAERTRLSKLGGGDWTKARTRAKAAAKQLAEGLIRLYAERAQQKGFAFPPDDAWQQEFEASFPYEETDDQLRCVQEIKADMETDRPMDRLLCGDVGFGKTEVALRAVMKCILAGKQAAMLVPTTVLARQHFLTASSRFSGYPIKIELLSRYKTAAEQKKILEQLKTGMIDLVIGTHKLLGKKIEFAQLGLLVIDEEQRFGVSHKEVLKEMSRQVDVLTLSATPIPRTLNMALSGIRDMSTIEEPPHDRHPVQTYVLEYSEPVVLDAIRRELARGGQVYYLHNMVESIDRTAARLQKALPDARIAVAHGKMTQRALTSAMTEVSDGEVDILVCTTIIETGIDIPNVNTLIIENADHMGLAQLHQIRGRVGRSSRRAFAYLTYRHGRVLSEIAQKRLSAAREFAEFGSGFKIAMRDLEIRGAGNVLGPEQSGHMMSVGYDLYLKLLEEAVLEEKGETPPQRVECAAELTLSANLPADYVDDPGQRVDLYRRIALIRSAEARSDLLDELIDRYGEPPAEALALLDIALLRAEAADEGVTEIKQQEGRLLLTFGNADFARLSALCSDKEYKGRLLLSAGNKPYVSLRLKSGEAPLDMARSLVRKYTHTA